MTRTAPGPPDAHVVDPPMRSQRPSNSANAPFRSARRTCAALLVAFTIVSCGGGDASANGDESSATNGDHVTVVCTTAMIGDLANEIAGDDAKVTVLFGPEVDPHLFRPTRDDVALLMAADLVLYNGFHLEGYLTETLERVADSGARVVAIAEEIVEADELLTEGDAPDPHAWMDASIWSRSCDVIADALVAEFNDAGADLDAQVATDVRARADVAEARLLELDATFAKELATIPESARVLVTAHDAFGYFGRRYDMSVEGIQGISTASEAGLLAIEDLVDRLVTRDIPAVFFESTVSERNVRALVEGAAARGHEVTVGGVLHSDAPGKAVRYEAMLRHNVTTIVGALGGSAAREDSKTRGTGEL